TADAVRLEALQSSTFKTLAEAVRVLRIEERYHLEHATAWFERLASGPVEARQRFHDALGDALPEAMALFEPLPGEDALLADGTMPASSEQMLARWLGAVGTDLERAGLERVLETGSDAAVG